MCQETLFIDFILTVNLAPIFLGEATKTDEPYIPYVPYPINPHTGQRVDTKLKPMTNKSEFKWGLPMSDPSLGLHVPILAMTTGSVIPIGGVHTDPVTGLPVPIEVSWIQILY